MFHNLDQTLLALIQQEALDCATSRSSSTHPSRKGGVRVKLSFDRYREERTFAAKSLSAPAQLVVPGGSTTTTSTAALVLRK